MKKILYGILILGCAGSLLSCSDDKLSSDAEILYSFTAMNEDGRVFQSTIGENTITLKVAPELDPDVALASCTPSFYLSYGATVSPDPTIPQNFSEPVVYTVTAQDGKTTRSYTVGYGISDILEYGEGFTYSDLVVEKLFTDLGFPGEYGNTSVADSKLYGDIRVSHSYCGDYIVLMSRIYIELDDPDHSFKTVDKTTLEPGPAFNLGSISPYDLKLISSDYYGRMVGAVVKGGTSEFFYWTSPTASPVSIGSINIDVASSTDGSANMQIAGDITGNAWITAMAPRSDEGNHYRIKVTDGRLASDYTVYSTNLSSSDSNGFQMISPLDDSDEPSFVVGDAEGSGNGSVMCYNFSFAGLRAHEMPPFWNTNFQNSWWIGTGATLARTGARCPVVSGMVINGKSYSLVLTGNNNNFAAAVLSADLQFLSHDGLNIAQSVSSTRNWGYGDWADWYWDEENKEGHLAIWIGRWGLKTYIMTCYE